MNDRDRPVRTPAAWLLAAGLAVAALCPTRAVAETRAGLTDFQEGRFAEAMQEWRDAAETGDARGALFVGVLYDTGLGVPQDRAQALEWYRRAAAGGSAAGTFNVGVMYDSGLGVPQDRAEAATWYARAAEQGYARAAYNLAMLYETGQGVPRDRNRAVRLYTEAAGNGIYAARAHLIRLGRPFAGTPRDTQDAALRDFQQAQQLLLTRGPAAADRAVTLFRRSAEQNNPLAEYDLAYCYAHGMGVARDDAAALTWYQRAAAHTSDGALRALAVTGIRNLGAQHDQPETP